MVVRVKTVREKIVEAAADRFHTLGFHACGVQEIVETAGVPKGSFYNYFKAKELLALEVLEIYSRGSGGELLADHSRSALERLRAHFDCMAARYARLGYAKGCLIGNLVAESTDDVPLIREALAVLLVRWTAAITATLREGQAAGEIVAELDAEATARFLINSWEGAVVRMKISANREPLDDFFKIVFPLLTRSTPIGEQPAPRRRVAKA